MNNTSPVSSYLSFHIGAQRYGIRLAEVNQILHLVMLTELAGGTSGTLGLMTLRDCVVPVIDLRIRFGMEAPVYKLNTPIITIHTESGMIAFIVDDVDTVEDVPERNIIPYQGSPFPDVRAVAKLPHGILLLLDTNRLSTEVQLPERSGQDVDT